MPVALEAVQAAKQQDDVRASEELDWALRTAFYRESRPIGLLTEVLAVAAGLEAVDAALLERELATGLTAANPAEDDVRRQPD